MSIALSAAIFACMLLLILVSAVQMLYLESLRLRARELPAQQFFREALAGRIGPSLEDGSMAFSVWKHGLLVLLGAAFLAWTVHNSRFSLQALLEACGLAWLAMLLAGYAAPQALYRRTTGQWLVPLVPILRGLAVLMRPVAALLMFLQSLVELGNHDEQVADEPTPEENIDALITAGAEEGIIEEEDRRLIHSVVAFGDKTVREVMTPRPGIVGIPAAATLEELRQLVINEQYSRIPVYGDSIDDVLGFIHVRDMFELNEEDRAARKVSDLMRPVPLVPETKPVNDLLREMQQEGSHMAVVVDEYGNTAGLATMEDLVEEIVGEIRDEHEPATDVIREPDGSYLVSGSFDVDHLADLVGARLNEQTESTTVGGLVTEWLGRVPEVGEKVEKDGVRIEVLASNELRVDRVRISRTENGGKPGNGRRNGVRLANGSKPDGPGGPPAFEDGQDV
ncbi:MAG: HlyC/CorC family transporter [Acidobacteria bacterium]|nr:HlyC/CorC family transporter [Acidobacteriota bacterium]